MNICLYYPIHYYTPTIPMHCIYPQAIRVAAVQSSNMLANYLQDQLQADFAREELVKDGKLTAKKADEQQEEWEQVRRGWISHFFCFGMHLGLVLVI